MNTTNEQGIPASNSSTVFSVAQYYRDIADTRNDEPSVLLQLTERDVSLILDWAESHMRQTGPILDEEAGLQSAINNALEVLILNREVGCRG